MQGWIGQGYNEYQVINISSKGLEAMLKTLEAK
jgi:hypothetical protein